MFKGFFLHAVPLPYHDDHQDKEEYILWEISAAGKSGIYVYMYLYI